MSILEDTERTRFCPQTDRQTDGQGDTSIPPFQLRWSGGYNKVNLQPLSCHDHFAAKTSQPITTANGMQTHCKVARIAKWHRGICIHNAIPRITNTMQDPHWMYGSNKWVQNQTLPTERDHSGYGISQWEEALWCNASFHWLSPYPKWSLNRLMQYHCISIVNPCPVVHRIWVNIISADALASHVTRSSAAAKWNM